MWDVRRQTNITTEQNALCSKFCKQFSESSIGIPACFPAARAVKGNLLENSLQNLLHKAFCLSTLEIGYSDTVYFSKNCHYIRLFFYQMLLMESYLNKWKVQNCSIELFKYNKCSNDKSIGLSLSESWCDIILKADLSLKSISHCHNNRFLSLYPVVFRV